MRLRLSLLLGALISTVVLTTACASIGGGQKPVISLYDGQWESLWANNALSELIIEEGYGYSVETVVVSGQVMQERLPNGEIGLDMEIWEHSRIGWCHEQMEIGNEDESLRPLDQACAYAGVAIDQVDHQGLLQQAPDVLETLRRTLLGLEPLNETLAWAKENDLQEWRVAATYYLQTYEDRWQTWVTPEAYESIKEAVQEASR